MPSLRHDTAFVTAIGGRACTSSLWDSWVIYLFQDQQQAFNVVRVGSSLLQDLRFRCLRIAKVHHFVKKFVDNDKVIPYTFLLQLLEVFCKDLNDLMKKEEYFGCIGVALSQGQEIEVVMTDV